MCRSTQPFLLRTARCGTFTTAIRQTSRGSATLSPSPVQARCLPTCMLHLVAGVNRSDRVHNIHVDFYRYTYDGLGLYDSGPPQKKHMGIERHP